jgi:hypothetical protein
MPRKIYALELQPARRRRKQEATSIAAFICGRCAVAVTHRATTDSLLIESTVELIHLPETEAEMQTHAIRTVIAMMLEASCL